MMKFNKRCRLHSILSARNVKKDIPGNRDSLLHQANVLIFSPLTKLLENKASSKLQSRSETSSRGTSGIKVDTNTEDTVDNNYSEDENQPGC